MKQEQFQESIELFIKRNIYSVEKKDSLLKLVQNYETTLDLVKSIKVLFELMKRIQEFADANNF